MRDTYYITTPIYYVNDVPHIGHAYTTLACDVIARFMRLDGKQVKFLTGTDEHGQKVEKAAKDVGLDPQAYTDRISQNFRDLAKAMNFSNDDFIRTTEERHVKSCQALWRQLLANNQIYLGKYAGWYAVRDEAFYGEGELRDEGGKKIAPSGAVCEWVEEPSYFFRLSAWQQPLLEFYEKNPDFVAPTSRRNEVISFVKGGLADLSVSRTTFGWGIPVPDDPKHIVYVWFDALINYITAAGYPDTASDGYRKFWPADLHMVGKDILRFHAVYWPAFLMGAGLPPPQRVFAHGWWTNEGQKISKSLGNVIDPHELIKQFGLDQVRYFLLREVPFGNDGDFSRQAMINRMNNDLADKFGNLSQRILKMIQKNCDAKLPAPSALTGEDQALLDSAARLLSEVRTEIQQQSFHRALDAIWLVIADGNKYVDSQAPWTLRKSGDLARMNTVLYVVAELVRQLAILCQPFMPESCGRMLDQLAVPPTERTFSALTKAHALKPGTALPDPAGIFPKFVDTGVAA